MYATDFVYADERLSDYGLIICSFDGSLDGAVASGADINFVSAKSAGTNKFHLYSTGYEEAYTASFAICKNPCIGDTNPYLASNEIAALQRWLCRTDGYHKFKIDDADYANIWWNGSFTSQEYLIGGHCAGLILTLYTDAPFGYKDPISVQYNNVAANGSFTIYDQSEITGYHYPTMIITFNSDAGSFSLQNSRDKKICKINNCSRGEVITLDGEHLTITSNKASHAIANDFNYYFPRLFNSYESRENVFTPNTGCTIVISYSPSYNVGI